MTRVEKFEEKLFAYSLTNENLKGFVQEIVNSHLKSFNSFLVLEMAISTQNQSQNFKIMKKNYQLFSKLLAHYYQIGVDKRLPGVAAFFSKKMIHSTHSLFDQQMRTAKLREATLSDFVDLKG
jgi:hypothetical protein